ncbi:MAG: DsbA family oxidoreductase [Pseudomonadota bacterium]
MEEQSARPRLVIDIVSDPVCPWCFVGFKSFQAARERLATDYQILPRLRAYLLNPGTPEAGVDRAAHYENKFPDKARREEMAHTLRAAAVGAGFKFDPAKPTVLPNTIKAQQVIRWAHYNGAQERVAGAIFSAYWEEGADIGDRAVLGDIAASSGLDLENALSVMDSAKSKNEILAESEAFRRTGVTGVPTFIVNERTGFSGALPPARLAAALREAADGSEAAPL